MKKGKYVGAKFTVEQRYARSLWEKANAFEAGIADALTCLMEQLETREKFLKVAAQRWDKYQNLRERAKEKFPEVEESFTIASGWMSI